MGLGLTKQGDLGLPFPDNAQKDDTQGFKAKADPANNIRRHRAIDWGLYPGTPVCAMYHGTVNHVTNSHVRGGDPYEVLGLADNPGLANKVHVLSDTGNGNGFEIRYGHLSQMFVEDGQFVRKGDLLGLSGHTGWSSGPHLHVEVRPRDDLDNPVDFTGYLPTGYDTNTFVTHMPAATRKVDDNGVAQVIHLYSHPGSSSSDVSLPVAVAAWLDSGGNVITSTELGALSGTFTLDLTNATVTLTVSGVEFAGTNDRYVAVAEGSLPANLRPPVWMAKTTVDLGNSLSERLYVSQNGKIYHRNSRALNSNPETVSTATLTWNLAYSVIGKDHPTTPSWWQIVVPGLDPAGEVGWVPDSAVEVTSPKQVQVTWPPPPTELEGSGTYVDPAYSSYAIPVKVDLTWEKPEDLWTGRWGPKVSMLHSLYYQRNSD